MSARCFSDAARNCISGTTTKGARYASSVAARKPGQPVHGEQIYIFNHLQTNRVIYSLSKELNNNASIAQLPFTGKKSVPAALRKDHWTPLATITFPPGTADAGLTAYQKLREYRKLHELSWDPNSSVFKDKKGKPLNSKERSRKLNDQKANSVADMAAVLEDIREGNESIGLKGIGAKKIVEVKWRNMNDVEWAAKWSDAVKHGEMEWRSNNRELPHERRNRMIALKKEKKQRRERLKERLALAEGSEQDHPVEEKTEKLGEHLASKVDLEQDHPVEEEPSEERTQQDHPIKDQTTEEPMSEKKLKKLRHLALMESMKGTRQSYESRGKWKWRGEEATKEEVDATENSEEAESTLKH